MQARNLNQKKGGTEMKRILIMTLLSFLVAASWALAAEVFTPTVEKPGSESFVGYVPDRVVVKFDQSTTRKMNRGTLAQGKTGVKALDDLGTRHGVAFIERQFPGAKRKNYKGKAIALDGWHRVRFHDKVDVLKIVEDYKKIPGVIDAQPISIHTVYREPMEQFYDMQWHLPRIQAPEAWDIETGNSTIVVAILDTGVRYFQKDLGGVDASYFNPTAAEGNMWINWVEKDGLAGVDDDENGYVDDWIGWDFVADTDYGFLYPCYPGEDCSDADNDPRDFNGHGTHCAGSVGAMNNNNEALASVTGGWGNGGLERTGNGVKVMPLRIGWSIDLYGLDYEVGVVEMDYAAEALQYAADNGARIASCSWGSENTGGLADAIDYFLASGGLIFKAAGNEDVSTPDYMGSRDDIINVAATDESDCKASFSNYGTWVDIAAPGVYIWSLFHDHYYPDTDYVAPLDGTSMAAPLAASVAALTWSHEPSLSAEEVKQMLYLSADPIDGLSCNSMYAGELGAGRVNAYQAVHLAPTADFTADVTCGYDSLEVTFTDESQGSVTDWSWDFGDGSTSTQQNPSHTYGGPGTYTVKLTVYNPYGSDDEIKVDFITVNEPGADLNMEVGEVSDLNHNWKQVNLGHCFVDPVVVAKPLSYNGLDPSVVRMRNIDGTGFEMRVQEWDYKDGKHDFSETVSYVVMERGIHFLGDGTQVEAGSFMTNLTSSFGNFSFSQSFRVEPVVVAAVASFNEGDAVTDRLRNITTEGFEFHMQEQDANVQSHNVETIHYIAWEPGSGIVNGLNFEVATSGDAITHQFEWITFGEPFMEEPRFLADMQTTDGGDASAVRWYDVNPYGIKVKIEEEQSKDSETNHTTEAVGYMAFSTSAVQ
jgi:PKD repeat protein